MSFIEFFFASGISGLLARMCHDLYDIKKGFRAMEASMKKIQLRLAKHEQRISNLEKAKEQGA